MYFDGAVIREQGVTFAIAVVKPGVVDNPSRRDEVQGQFSRAFGGLPTVLMSQDARGTPRFYGRKDIVRFLANVPMRAIRWKRYRLDGA